MGLFALTNVQAAGVEWQVTTGGSRKGVPLLFVHGFPLDSVMWVEAAIPFAKSTDFRLIAPDLPGFGKSQAWPQATVTMGNYADGLHALLDAMNVLEPITLIGLSMGGYIAFEFWRRHRDRLRALVLADTRAAPDSSEAAAGRRKTAASVLANGMDELAANMTEKLFAGSTKQQNPALLEHMRRVMLQAKPASVSAALLGMAERADASPWLEEIAIPTLVVCGAEDAITGPTEMEALARALPNAEYVSIPNAGHLAPAEQPQAFANALAAFLKRVHRAD